MKHAKDMARNIAALALPAHADDPVWIDYVAAYAGSSACQAHFPDIAALALSNRRDWYTDARLQSAGADFLTVTQAAMLALCARQGVDELDRRTADAVLDLIAWHQLQEAAASKNARAAENDEIPI